MLFEMNLEMVLPYTPNSEMSLRVYEQEEVSFDFNGLGKLVVSQSITDSSLVLENRDFYFAETGAALPNECGDDNYVTTIVDYHQGYVLHVFDVTGEVLTNRNQVIYRYALHDNQDANFVHLHTERSYKGGSVWGIVQTVQTQTQNDVEFEIHVRYVKKDNTVRDVHGLVVSVEWIKGEQFWRIMDFDRGDYRSMYPRDIIRWLNQAEVTAWRNRGF